jgi:hypothetical protein
MNTFGDMAKALNRFPVQLSTLQKQFALPAFEGAAYSDAYQTFLRTVISLRTLNVSDSALLDLWDLEKKLLQLLHADSTGSATWFLDECGRTTHPNCRLLLTNYDIGMSLDAQGVQPGLNFDKNRENCSPAQKWVRTPCACSAKSLRYAPVSRLTSPPKFPTFVPP